MQERNERQPLGALTRHTLKHSMRGLPRSNRHGIIGIIICIVGCASRTYCSSFVYTSLRKLVLCVSIIVLSRPEVILDMLPTCVWLAPQRCLCPLPLPAVCTRRLDAPALSRLHTHWHTQTHGYTQSCTRARPMSEGSIGFTISSVQDAALAVPRRFSAVNRIASLQRVPLGRPLEPASHTHSMLVRC